jgi:hypothetical protein
VCVCVCGVLLCGVSCGGGGGGGVWYDVMGVWWWVVNSGAWCHVWWCALVAVYGVPWCVVMGV